MGSFLMQKIDLHCHSTASDGSLSPKKLVEKAKNIGISILSVTDHDTVSGVSEAVEEGKKLGIKVIPGIEVTADTTFLGKGKREFHILGYYVDVESKAIKELTEFFQSSRIKRNEELLSKLEDRGYNISYEEMVSLYGLNFGKPNIVKVLIDRGYFKERDEAIDFLSSLRVKREKLDYREITRLIDEAGGIAIIAHPVTLKISYQEIYSFLKNAKKEKISGLEVFHYKHIPADVVTLKKMCKDLDLYFTGGSDFHGDNKPCIELGFLKITALDINFSV
ncbi:PHP domain protein [Desulfurobacterium thermolithotrophum DSM 11699]|uniref:PHP domain protein n=1 Tax=Desulfurobacterium thermolithotrophum (strain DSM 11699 / BSA) TaxID=868864 RepID=F0S453_DESTD|nr:PHP domain-containing protein [Desulfurobacterium thermolithotrophum]ADY73625.1 PHP domain protein [Desulfurobacterium thermolithotrophum DSM 11699]